MKGFKKDGKFRPTQTKTKSSLKKSDVRKKHTSSMPKGIEPHDTFSKQEKLRLLSEDDLSRHYSNQQLEDIRNDIDATIRSFENQNDPEVGMLTHERRKVQGAMNLQLYRGLGGGTVIPEFESTGFPEIDADLPDHKKTIEINQTEGQKHRADKAKSQGTHKHEGFNKLVKDIEKGDKSLSEESAKNIAGSIQAKSKKKFGTKTVSKGGKKHVEPAI